MFNKKIAIELAVGIIVLIALTLGGYLILQEKKAQSPAIGISNPILNENCAGEGKAIYSETSKIRSCCPELKTISKIDEEGNRFYDVAFCTKCGDGDCKNPENKYNCVEDCATNKISIANPASVYCEQNGGKIEIRTGSGGGQAGYCKFDNGSECEEWAFMRGECNSNNNSKNNVSDWKTYQNEKYGFEFKYLSSRCLLSQDYDVNGLSIEIFKNGDCPTLQERGDVGTLSRMNIESINAEKSKLILNEYIKKFRIKSQKDIVLNNVNWKILYLDCDTNEGEAPVCYNMDIFYVSKNEKNSTIFTIGTREEDSLKQIVENWRWL